MLDTTERPSTDKITEPAKLWRNWFEANDVGYFSHCLQRVVGPYEVYADPQAYPTKDIAEQKRFDLEARVVRVRLARGQSADCPGRYLGAHPDGVAP